MAETPERLPPTRWAPVTDDFPTGPAIGEPLHDFELPDHIGTPRGA